MGNRRKNSRRATVAVLLCERCVAESCVKSAWTGVHFDAPSLPQRVFGESAAEDADGRDARPAGRDSVVGRVADRDRFAPFDAKLLQHDFEDVRGRFRFIDVFGGRHDVYQVGDGRDVEVLLEFVLLRRGCYGDAETGLADALQEL
jgi:hypothetical protein